MYIVKVNQFVIVLLKCLCSVISVALSHNKRGICFVYRCRLKATVVYRCSVVINRFNWKKIWSQTKTQGNFKKKTTQRKKQRTASKANINKNGQFDKNCHIKERGMITKMDGHDITQSTAFSFVCRLYISMNTQHSRTFISKLLLSLFIHTL